MPALLYLMLHAGQPGQHGWGTVMATNTAFVIGKPAGILAFGWLAVRLKIAVRPPELAWLTLAGGGLLAGIGFTMALFIANLSFSENLVDSAKLGIFPASVVSALAGIALLALATSGRTRAVPAPYFFLLDTRAEANRPSKRPGHSPIATSL